MKSLHPLSLPLGVFMTIIKITDKIYVSGLVSLKAKQESGIRYAINLSGQRHKDAGAEKQFRLIDGRGNKSERIVKLLEIIDLRIKHQKYPLLIHCAQGKSRSPAIIALYLVYRGRFSSFEKAVDYVASINPGTQPNQNLIDFLRKEVIPLIKLK